MTSRKTYPPVVVVDENDNEIGSALLADVWREGLYHRVVAVFVVDDQERMLLQLRGPAVAIYPSCWDQAAGGHVDEGFDYDQTAAAETAEEIGLQGVTLKTLGTFRSNHVLDDGRRINQFERVYVARVPHGTKVTPEHGEVSRLQWFTPVELKVRLTQKPDEFTPGLLHILRQYFPEFWI